MILEVCIDSLASARAAIAGGADRLELCSALALGGLTPYTELLRQIRRESKIAIRCLMRPRAGDFLYTPEEIELMAAQIRELKSAGADGFVIGCLTPEGNLDKDAMKPLIEAADGAGLTLHRCIDVSRDPIKTYLDAKDLGIDTVLTSGAKGNCLAGLDTIGKLLAMRDQENGPDILIGAGVKAPVIEAILARCPNAKAFHMSGKVDLESGMIFRRDEVPMGIPGLDEWHIQQTSREAVREARYIIHPNDTPMEVSAMNLNEAVLLKKDQMIRSLQENIRIPSVESEPAPGAPYGVEVRKSLDHALETAQSLGFSVTNMDGHMGWCEYGEGEEMVAVLGHLDVVPAGEGWSVAPYGGDIIDGKIFGRGTTDDKGPSIAALYALAALRDAGLPIKRRIRVLLGCNEETGSEDVKYYLDHGGEVPVMGFTPDGEYPVINGEKGIINATFTKTYTQDGDLKLVKILGGTATNVVPSYAKAIFECNSALAEKLSKLYVHAMKFSKTETGFIAESFGTSAHGSTPGLGENAIGRLILAMDNLPLTGELADAVHFLAEKIGMETDGTSAGIALNDAVSGGLTLNWGTMEGDDKSFTLKINYRYPVTFGYEDCGPKFNALFTNAGFTLAHEMHKAKLYIPADSQLVTSLLKVYTQETGLEGYPICIGGGTYAKAIPNILACGPIFPGDEIREHKADEYISIDNLVKNAQIIAAAMYELAK